MCTHCGCGLPDPVHGAHRHGDTDVHPPAAYGHGADIDTVQVLRRLLDDNDRIAAHNREHFDARGVLALNLMSSPGAGKTALLERTAQRLGGELSLAVVVGDLETDLDARRLRACGLPAHQISTGRACHLDARLLHDALHDFDPGGVDILFIENVGNLVCPASFDLGQHRNVVLLAVTEGHDKPAKYPVMFRAADLVLLSKSDLLPHLGDFDPLLAEAAVHRLAHPIPVWPASVRDDTGMDRWCDWLRHELRARRHARASVAAG
ncbi:MAG: hydrogenase nickel incorporation protein HypB [Gammaproteobacteria bacterium]|nr:hydrogenase nickel incorporation protein HypB [Gammaproteobacteria bacterium]